MTTHSGILAWEIPWTEEPGSLWGHRVGHNLASKQQKQNYCTVLASVTNRVCFP